jgi:glycine hydroxymethyltransferase
MNTDDMDRIAEAISLVVLKGADGVAPARAIVDELTAKYPLVQ